MAKKKAVKRKPRTWVAWIAQTPGAILMNSTVRSNRASAGFAYSQIRGVSWDECKREGCRAIRVRITEIPR